MGINLDSFIDELVKDKQTQQTENQQAKEQETINLNFEEGVEKNLQKINLNSASLKDIAKLHEIYEEIKQFDESLPQKFLSLEDLGGNSLEKIGQNYSTQYLQQVETITKNIEESVNKLLDSLSKALFDKNYTQVPQVLKELKKIVRSVPQESQLFLLEIKTKIKEKEIQVFQAIEEFKKIDLPRIRSELNSEIQILLKNIIPGNSKFVREQIEHLEHMFNSIPSMFRITLTNEELLLNKAVYKAQKYLVNELNQEVEMRIKKMNHLEEEFNSASFNKDLNKALVIYNQIVYEFMQTPNHPLDKKLQHLEKILDIHKKLNKLYINNNVTLFLETYNYSKIIEEAQDYIYQAKHSKNTIKLQNIQILQEKVAKLPQNFQKERNQLLVELHQVYQNILGYSYENTTSSQDSTYYSQDTKNDPFESFTSKEHDITKTSTQTTFQADNKKKTLTDPGLDLEHTYYKKDQNIHTKILHEIDELYKKFQQEKNKEKAQKYYKKIDFYLNFANIPEEKVTQIKKKIANQWSKKE